MTDFLTRLAQRQFGQIPTVQPLMPSMYTPYAERDGIETTEVEEKRQPAPSMAPESSWIPQQVVDQQDRQESNTSPAPLPTLPTKEQPLVEPMALWKPELEDSESSRPLIQPTAEAPVSPSILTAPTSNTQREFIHKTVRIPVRDPGHPSKHDARLPPPRLVEQKTPGPPVAPKRLDKAPDTVMASQPMRDREQNQPKAMSEPPVQVTIGRIEVTAVTQAPPAKRVAAPRKPAMSLDDYLTRRQGKGVSP